MPTPQTPTPETDAEVKRNEGKLMSVSSGFARKLERERNDYIDLYRGEQRACAEAKRERDEARAKWHDSYSSASMAEELTQLRKVCDELVAIFS